MVSHEVGGRGGTRADGRPGEQEVDAVVERTIALARVPAPAHAEQERAAIVSRWWRDDGLADVHVDAAGNVWGRAGGTRPPAVLVCAHLDTVFGADEPHEVRREGDLLLGRSVGDNSVAVAALPAVARRLAGVEAAVWCVATTGEEGLGNLRGIYHALAHPPQPVGAVVAVEGNYLGRVGVRGVASERWSVRLGAPGGHSWEAHDVPSAVHEAAEMITRITRPLGPPEPRRTVNVGLVSGGENVTSRAAAAALLVDIRSVEPRALAELRDRVIAAARAARERGVSVALSQVGRRGGGAIAPDHPLAAAACAVLRAAGREPEVVSASTDANAAYDLGIPAVTLGITEGDRQHSRDEWIRLSPIADGIDALARTIARYVAATGQAGATGRP